MVVVGQQVERRMVVVGQQVERRMGAVEQRVEHRMGLRFAPKGKLVVAVEQTAASESAAVQTAASKSSW